MVVTTDVFIKRPAHDYNEVKDWCRDNIGSDWWTDEKYGTWSWAVNHLDEVVYSFTHEQDAVMFKMRWL
jgi:hypothetical protein